MNAVISEYEAILNKHAFSPIINAHTDAHVATLAASQRVFAAAGARVHRDGLLNDETIFHQLPDGLSCTTHTNNTINLQHAKISPKPD